jgi:hypothetical protein
MQRSGQSYGGALQSRGAEGDRTLDLLNAIQALSQLSYSPNAIPPENRIKYSQLNEKKQPEFAVANLAPFH